MADELSPNRQPIAVVGVSALFPGSTDAAGFWRDILAGRDLIREVPESHWLVDDYYDPDPTAPDKTYARRGAFLDRVDFDALEWGVPPSTIPATDTSQLLALILAQKVLEDAAGEQFETMDRSRISVILGVTSAQELLSTMVGRLQRPVWVKSLRESGIPEEEVQQICDRIASHYVPWQESTFPGLLGNVVAGRIANRLNLGGTNCVTDAACASTLSALSMAVSELQLGSSDLVLSGGVDTLNDIFMFMCFSKTPALSPTGDCRPFSDKADGTMLGEGLGMVALKRLADAERDGDRIYAVIRGIGTSSDGRSKSVYAPVPEGQAQALRRAYALAGYGPETVELLEAHGTGTKAGDVAEFEGLRMVFDEADAVRRQWCALGSVKSQIGHAKAAAGAAGLFKAVMALHHKVLPPSIKIDAPNPKLRIEESAFYLGTKTRPWIRGGAHPRRASVSAFGFGGSNFHVALEEYTGPAPRAGRLQTGARELVLVCGESGADVARKAREMAGIASAPGAVGPLARRSQREYAAKSTKEVAEGSDSRGAKGAAAPARLALLAADGAELSARLLVAAARIEAKPGEPFLLPDGTAFGLGAPSGALAFLFPGQGSQYLGMGADLAMSFGAAREAWDGAAELLLEPGTPLQEVVFPRPGFGEGRQARDLERLTATRWAQPAIGCTSLSQLALLETLGLKPALVGGHSFGEVVALHAAGVLGRDDVLRVARRRGELMEEAAATPGAMTALSLPIEKVRELLERLAPRIVVANHNGPTQVVVSGRTADVEDFEGKLHLEGITARRLPVATAFHSDVVSASCEPFASFLSGVDFHEARLPAYSNARAAAHENDPAALRSALASQIASPVRFVEMVEAMYEAGARTFLEVGPGSVLSALVGRILDGRPHLAVNLDRRGGDGVESLLLALARLAAAGQPMDVPALYAEYREPRNAGLATAPRLAVAINGSNHGKLYPPPGGSRSLPAPNPPRPAISETPREEAVMPKTESPTLPPTIAAPAPQPLAGSPSAWVQAFQESQRQTAEAHAVFQRSMAESHAAYLRVAEAGFVGLTSMVTGTLVAAPQLPAPTWTPAVAPSFAPSAPAPIAAAPVAAVDLQALMLAVVAEKTGYPAEMLNLSMDLEGELGIDSIKRVEILAAVRDQAPDLPSVDMGHMGSLRTLGAIVDYMQGLRGSASPAAAATAMAVPGVVPRTAAPAVDLQALMLTVVAEKTGYPAEMLNLSMDLEGELGIDSIKRVEILAAVRDQAPDLPSVDMGHMGSLRTLGAIVDYMQALRGGAPPGASQLPVLATSPATPPAVVPAAFSAPVAPVLGRYGLERIEAPPTGLAHPGLLGGGVLRVTGGGTLGGALVEELRSRGVEATAGEPAADATACIYLGGLRDVASADEAIAVNREAFALARRLAATLEVGRGLFVTVQDTGGAFGTAEMDGKRAWLSGLPALVKTAGQEWPRASVKAIDLERAGRDLRALARALADELLEGGGEIEVALPATGGRFTLRSVARAVEPGEPVIGAGDVVVVSGGARGVTAACIETWARECRARFVLLGRTPLVDEPACCAGIEEEAGLKKALLADARSRGESLSPADLGARVRRVTDNREVRRNVAAIEAAGSEVRYEAVDVVDAGAVAATLDRVRAEWGSIAGLVHAAGVLADRKISAKTDAQFDLVFDTKVKGLRALLGATASDPLKLLCVFSSVSARCGNNGQADYAMANEVLSKVASAEARRRPELLVKSLGWGPWEGGMVTPQLRQRFAQLGVPMIPLAAGARMLADEMRSSRGGEVELVLGGAPTAESLLFEGSGERIQELELRVQRGSHGYLAGHAIGGTPVVPVVLAAEWLARAARSFRPGLSLSSLHDLKVLKGIRLRGFYNGGDRFVIQARPLPSRRGAQLQLDIRGPEGALHYSARAELLPEARTPETGMPELNLEEWSGEPLYEDLLFHRGAFEVIERVDGISDQGVDASVLGVDRAGWNGEHWQMDVPALDGALQLAVLFGQRMLDGASLPTSIGEVRTWLPEPGKGNIRAVAYARKVGSAAVTTDILLTDEKGQRLAELLGVENHALPVGVGKA